jgi:hypothetical protein
VGDGQPLPATPRRGPHCRGRSGWAPSREGCRREQDWHAGDADAHWP